MSVNNLGHATAYGYAKSKGYTGTEEEFAELMASYADVAQDAQASAEAAAGSATAAAGSANTATTAAQTATTKANEAAQSATGASQSATQAASAVSSAQASAQTATAKASEASQSAANAAASATTANNAADDATAAKTAAETAKTAAQTSASNAATSAQTAQQVLEDIPEDYTDLSNTVSDLLSAFEQLPTSIQPDMTVGSLMSEEYTEEKMPYLYRVAGGGIEVGKVEADEIVGGTIAWNQIYPIHNAYYVASGSIEGLTVDVTNGYINITGTATADAKVQIRPDTVRVPENHIVLMLCDGWNGFRWSRNGFTPIGAYDYFINKHSVDFTAMARIELYAGTTYNIHARFSSYDLTQMFGTTIADYLYSLETATAGAGVAVFRKMFPNAYYPYNAGELMHVSGVSEHVMTGFNQWDEEWEVGAYATDTGLPTSTTTQIRCKNRVEVVAGATYYICSPQNMRLYYYDGSDAFVGTDVKRNATITSGANVRYIRFAMVAAYGTTYNHDICINISSDRNGEYEPYEKHSYPLDSSLTLRGIPKLSDGEIYYDGDTYESDGTVTRKYGIVDLGTLTWQKFSVTQGTLFRTTISTSVDNDLTISANAICAKYPTVAQTSRAEKTLNSIGHLFDVIDSSYTTEQDFKTAMSGVYLVYELATPTTEQAEPYEEYQHVTNGGTEKYVSTGIVPVGHTTKYYGDIGSKVDKLPSDFSNIIAPTESAFKATRAYTVNDLIIIDNVLYKVTASIASGATITPNTNVQQTTLSALIKALSA